MLWPTRLQRRARRPLSKHPCRIIKLQEENLEHFLFLLYLYTVSFLVQVSALTKMYERCSFMLQGIRLPQNTSGLSKSSCVRHILTIALYGILPAVTFKSFWSPEETKQRSKSTIYFEQTSNFDLQCLSVSFAIDEHVVPVRDNGPIFISSSISLH